jgi:UDP-glucose 4-epimerase
MRILITGGFGLVGGRLGQHLHLAGHQIVLGSRNASDPPNWLAQAEVVKTSWNDGRVLEQICGGVDVVIHAAGMNAQDCAKNPVAALEFNGLTTARLVDAAIRSGVKRFIYLSTAHVYANPLIGTISEDSCPRNLHPYATSHLAGENVVLSAKMEGIVLRMSNAFGAPVHKDVNCWMLLVNDLCRQAVLTRKMVLRSNGLQQRDFIAIAEVCRVVEHLSACDFNALLSGVFNVGSGVSQSVLEMAHLIQSRCRQLLGFEPELHRPEAGDNENYERLQFRLNGLSQMGVNVSNDNNSEIDGLLEFCRSNCVQKLGESA